jgi:hypothetical protein
MSLKILNQGTVTPDIQRLCSVANSENGLPQVESITQQKLVNGSATRIRFAALRSPALAILFRINVIAATRKQNPLDAE